VHQLQKIAEKHRGRSPTKRENSENEDEEQAREQGGGQHGGQCAGSDRDGGMWLGDAAAPEKP